MTTDKSGLKKTFFVLTITVTTDTNYVEMVVAKKFVGKNKLFSSVIRRLRKTKIRKCFAQSHCSDAK